LPGRTKEYDEKPQSKLPVSGLRFESVTSRIRSRIAKLSAATSDKILSLEDEAERTDNCKKTGDGKPMRR
jgi:hypothetical protein